MNCFETFITKENKKQCILSEIVNKNLRILYRCGLEGAEPGRAGAWNPAAASVFEELLSQTVTLTVRDKIGDKYLVWLEDANGIDVTTAINSLGSFS